MKKLEIFLTVFLALVFTAQAQQKHLTILHTNDTHSQIEPLVDKELLDKGTVGGALWRAALIEQERQKDSTLLLLDAGDFSQGTPYFNVFKGFAEVELMNRMGYDFSTLGNHEFDNGIPALIERLQLADFQVLCSNYRFKSKALAKLIKPFAIIERNGLKIGLFGLTTNLEGLTSSEVTNNIVYLDAVEAAKTMVDTLKKANCDLIICMTHIGYFPEKPTQTIWDTLLAEKVDGIDVIIGGHTHTKLEQPDVVNGTQIVQTRNKGVYIGKMTITY